MDTSPSHTRLSYRPICRRLPRWGGNRGTLAPGSLKKVLRAVGPPPRLLLSRTSRLGPALPFPGAHPTARGAGRAPALSAHCLCPQPCPQPGALPCPAQGALLTLGGKKALHSSKGATPSEESGRRWRTGGLSGGKRSPQTCLGCGRSGGAGRSGGSPPCAPCPALLPCAPCPRPPAPALPLPSPPRLPPPLHTGLELFSYPGNSGRIVSLDFKMFVAVRMTHPTSAGFPGK